MSYQEKSTIVSLFGTAVIFIIYSIKVFQKYQELGLNATNDFKFCGTAILILIPVLAAFQIISLIVLNIVNVATTSEEAPSFTDELDKLIQLKSVRNFCYMFLVGFFLSMGLLVIDMPPRSMFISLGFSLIVSVVFGDMTTLYLYRRGV